MRGEAIRDETKRDVFTMTPKCPRCGSCYPHELVSGHLWWCGYCHGFFGENEDDYDLDLERRRRDSREPQPEPWWPDWLAIIAALAVGAFLFWLMGS